MNVRLLIVECNSPQIYDLVLAGDILIIKSLLVNARLLIVEYNSPEIYSLILIGWQASGVASWCSKYNTGNFLSMHEFHGKCLEIKSRLGLLFGMLHLLQELSENSLLHLLLKCFFFLLLLVFPPKIWFPTASTIDTALAHVFASDN